MTEIKITDPVIRKNVKLKLHFELVNILFAQVKNMLWAEIFAGTLILFVLWFGGHYERKFLLLSWYLSMIVFTGLPRLLLANAYKRAPEEDKKSHRWKNRLLFLLLLSGIGWSITGTVLLPTNPLNQALVLFLLIGVAAAANPFYSPLKQGYALFLIPILFFTALFLMAKGGNFYIFTALGLLSFGMLMLITSVISSGLIANMLKLNFRNFELTRNLIKTNRTLEKLATIDMLTGIPNRQFFTEKLIEATRSDQQTPFALLFLDLDKFKHVNDTLGHDTGDELLKTVAARLKKVIGPENELGRLGGDEFLILLKNAEDREDIIAFANKLQKSFETPIVVNGSTLDLTTSIGIALYPADGSDVHTLIKNADSAMYQTKKHENGNFKFFK